MREANNRIKVERELKKAFSGDRSKIQIGRIGQFGLLKMSRQRTRPSFLEQNTETCQHCQGRGRIRPVYATASSVMRAIYSELQSDGSAYELIVSGSEDLIFHLIKHRKAELAAIEEKFDVVIAFNVDKDSGADGFFIDKHKRVHTKNNISALSKIDDTPYNNSKEYNNKEQRKDSSTSFKQQKQQISAKEDVNVDLDEEEKQLEAAENAHRNKNRKKIRKKKPFNKQSNKEASATNNYIEKGNVQIAEEIVDTGNAIDNKPNEKHNKNKRYKYRDTGNVDIRAKKYHQKNEDRIANIDEEETQENNSGDNKHNNSLLKEIWRKIVD